MRGRTEGQVAEFLGLIGFGSLLAVSLTVGIRLLLLARRTRRLPELAMGLNFVVAGFLGYALLVAAESLHLFPERLAGFGSFFGVTGISIGGVLVCLFTQRVFHAHSRVALAALVLLSGWFGLASYGAWILNVEKAQAGFGVWFGHWGSNVGMFAAYAWSTLESLRYYALMQRRARIGIGDPLVANRFLLWGIGTLATLLVTLLYIGTQLFGHYELPASLIGVSSMLVLVTAIAEWLAFLPPRSYRERFARA
jgi:hypothetical protein